MEAAVIFLGEEKPFSEYSRLLPFISEERRERIERMAVNGDKIRSLFAELLIRYEAFGQLGVNFKEPKIEKNAFGKPFIAGLGGYDFSVSHSDRAVAFAGGFSAVGADIERIRPRKNSVSKRFFTENEMNFIEKSEDRDEAFFEIWTKKEAYSKMLGKGLAAGFNSFDVTDGSLDCKFQTQIMREYIFSVCLEQSEDIQPKITEISEDIFLQRLSECLNFTID